MKFSSTEMKETISLNLSSLDLETSSRNLRNSTELLSIDSDKVSQSSTTKQIFVNGMKRDTYGATIDQIDIVSAKVLLYCHKAWLDPSTRIDLLVGIEELRPQGIWNCKNTIILSFFRSELKQMLQQVLKIQPLLAPPLKKYLCTVSIFNIPDKSYRS